MGTQYQGSNKEKTALNAFIKLNRAADSISVATKSVYTRYGLTESQLAVMEALFHLGPLSQLDIGHKVLRTRGNITLVIKNLEKLGYITRHKTKEDRRFYSVRLTKKGQGLMERLFPEHAQCIAQTMSILTEAEQISLGKICKKLGTRLMLQAQEKDGHGK